MEQKYSIKLVLIGDDGVGKTSLYYRRGYKQFPVDYIPTVFDGFVEDMVTRNGHRCNIAYWDTVGNEEYRRLRPLSYPNTDVLAILFSISDRNSFENCLKIWYPESQAHIPNHPIILVGTKSDLKSGTRDKTEFVTTEEGREMANKINAIQYIEVSSLNDTNVSELFELVCQTHINNISNNKSNNNRNNNNNNQDSESDDEINSNNNKKRCIIN